MNSTSNIQHWPEIQATHMELSGQTIECRELLEDVPALFWLIAWYASEKGLSSLEVQKLVSQKRRDILKTVIGKGTNTDVKFLRKLKEPDGKWSMELLKLIIKAIEYDIPFKLRHIQSISIDLIGALDRYSKLADAKIIGKLISKKYLNRIQLIDAFQRISLLWDDIVGLGELLSLDPVSCLKNCPSIEAMRKLHNRWTVLVNSNADLVSSLSQFPEAPIKGNNSIIQIRNEEDLLAEGRLMHHCIGGYAERLRQEKCYIFRMLTPQRATLEIRRQGKRIEISSLKLANNQTPSEESYETVNTWIETYIRSNSSEGGLKPETETYHPPPHRGNTKRSNHTRSTMEISPRSFWKKIKSRDPFIDYDIPIFYPSERA